jgi:hypothetical protein
MSIIDETWTYDGRWINDAGNRPVACADYDGDETHAKLMAAAPELARVLVAVEWLGDSDRHGPYCVACNGLQPCTENASAPVYYGARIGHYPECTLLAALVKAGLR